jgi:hypothetical protein
LNALLLRDQTDTLMGFRVSGCTSKQ